MSKHSASQLSNAFTLRSVFKEKFSIVAPLRGPSFISQRLCSSYSFDFCFNS